jgi:hypothetical protein
LRIVVLEWHGSDPARQKMQELWGAQSTIVRVIINNAVGQTHVTIDPASLEFHFSDYTTLKAVPPKEILETAKADRDYYVKRYGGEWSVPPRGVRTDGLAFFSGDHESQQCPRRDDGAERAAHCRAREILQRGGEGGVPRTTASRPVSSAAACHFCIRSSRSRTPCLRRRGSGRCFTA